MEQIEVNILGRSYRLACAPDEKSELLAAVTLVDKKMQSLKESKKIAGADRIAVMAALQLAHEILAMKTGTHTNFFNEKNGIDSDEIRHRLQGMSDMIDTVLAPQDQLF
jgi:cell division protein ZapA